jgi:hypothetical protein
MVPPASGILSSMLCIVGIEIDQWPISR